MKHDKRGCDVRSKEKIMKTLAELETHLRNYREKKADFPSYADLIELIVSVRKADSDILKMPKKLYVRASEWMPGGLEVMAVNHKYGHEYIRADIAKEREAKLLSTLKDARLTIDDYAPHAGEYLMEKYRLKETLNEYDSIITEFEEMK